MIVNMPYLDPVDIAIVLDIGWTSWIMAHQDYAKLRAGEEAPQAIITCTTGSTQKTGGFHVGFTWVKIFYSYTQMLHGTGIFTYIYHHLP